MVNQFFSFLDYVFDQLRHRACLHVLLYYDPADLVPERILRIPDIFALYQTLLVAALLLRAEHTLYMNGHQQHIFVDEWPDLAFFKGDVAKPAPLFVHKCAPLPSANFYDLLGHLQSDVEV